MYSSYFYYPFNRNRFCCFIIFKISGFSYGGNSSGIFVVAYTETGCVYQWGKDIGKEIPMDICVPQLLHIPKKIAVVACGVEHCLALSVDGEVREYTNI